MSFHDIITVYHIIISFYHYVYIYIYISLSIPAFLAAMVASLPWIVWISLQFWLSLLSFQHRVHCWLEHGLVWPKCEKPSCHMMQDTRRNVFWWNLMNFSISLWISCEMRIVLILHSVIWWSLWCLEPPKTHVSTDLSGWPGQWGS